MIDNKKIKIAIVHDFLVQYGGAERCLEAFKELFPEAPVFTLLFDEKKLDRYKGWDIRTSVLQKSFFWRKSHYLYFPLYQWAIEQFDLSGYDIVLSSSVNYANGVIVNRGLHVCYCYCVPRFVYCVRDRYLRDYNYFSRYFINFFIEYFKRWDKKAKTRPDYFIADSRNTRAQLKECYGIDSEVIYPPVDTEFFKPADKPVQESYFLVVSRMKEYKNVELAVQACKELKLRLKVIGTGNYKTRLKPLAGQGIEFLGFVSDERLLECYQGCRALIVPAEEDFGLVAVEAQACGKPVISVKRGGALETVKDGLTGIFFADETLESLSEALVRFGHAQFDPEKIRENILPFGKEIFKERIRSSIFSLYDKHLRAKENHLKSPQFPY